MARCRRNLWEPLPFWDTARMSSAVADPLATLNAAQREAVCAGSDAPLLIIAGAGTGKTTTLAHRIAKLVIAIAPILFVRIVFS